LQSGLTAIVLPEGILLQDLEHPTGVSNRLISERIVWNVPEVERKHEVCMGLMLDLGLANPLGVNPLEARRRSWDAPLPAKRDQYLILQAPSEEGAEGDGGVVVSGLDEVFGYYARFMEGPNAIVMLRLDTSATSSLRPRLFTCDSYWVALEEQPRSSEVSSRDPRHGEGVDPPAPKQ
jgi:hypothetical protein